MMPKLNELGEALSALADMWNQYCPPHLTHGFMSAGENAEDVLTKYNLLRPNETAIYIDFEWDEVPEATKKLLTANEHNQ